LLKINNNHACPAGIKPNWHEMSFDWHVNPNQKSILNINPKSKIDAGYKAEYYRASFHPFYPKISIL